MPQPFDSELGAFSMNPSADRAIIDEAYAADPASARAEYGAEFREDLESFVSAEAVERVVVKGRSYLPPEPGNRYSAFCDPAGGSGGDSMTLAVARQDSAKSVVCRLVEWRPPFSPDDATAQCAAVLREYGLTQVTGDHYAGDWPTDRFRAHGIRYDLADRSKSELYAAFLSLVNDHRVELLDHQRTNKQLLALERSTSRLGKDSISHPPRGHDDLINAVAGALVQAAARTSRPGFFSVDSFTKSWTQPLSGRVVDRQGTRYLGDGHFMSRSGEHFRDPRYS